MLKDKFAQQFKFTIGSLQYQLKVLVHKTFYNEKKILHRL